MAAEDKRAGELGSWKEIADYLSVNVRTAQRWESELGLPVRRLAGRVVADTGDLDRWRKSAAARSGWWHNLRLLRAYAVVTTAALAIIGSVSLTKWIRSSRTGSPAAFRWEGRQFIATDVTGRELWRWSAQANPRLDLYEDGEELKRVRFADLDDDGNVETLLAFAASPDEFNGSAVYCFGKNGRVRWRFVPGKKVTSRTREYSEAYSHRNLAVFQPTSGDRMKRVAIVSVHQWGSLSQLAVLDAHGRQLGEYWHLGHLDAVAATDLDGDGVEELLAGGVDDPAQQAVLRVFDARYVSGAAVQTDGGPAQLLGFTPGSEKAVVRFPRSAVNQKVERFNSVDAITTTQGVLQVKVREHSRNPYAHVLYVFGQSLRLQAVEPSVSLKTVHQTVAAAGQLADYSDAEMDKLRGQVKVVALR